MTAWAAALPPLAAAACLVLGFALLRETAFGPTSVLVRAQLLATAAALLADALLATTAAREAVMATAAAITAATGLSGRAFAALERRVGMASRPPRPFETVSWILAALASILLAAILLGRTAGRPVILGLAVALIGLLLAVRRGGHVVQLMRLAALGDGLALLAVSLPDTPPAAIVAPTLLMPALLLVAQATLGRAGGMPASGEGG